MFERIWKWIEVFLMTLGIIYIGIVTLAFLILMLPPVILFESNKKVKKIGGNDD